MMSQPTTPAKESCLELETNLKNLFLIFDEDDSGAIDATELKHIIERLGKSPTPEEMVEVISIVDYTDDGEVGHT